jgi:hypothetical protein
MPDWTDLLQRRPDLLRVEGERRERMIQELADHLEDLYQEALRLGATEEEAEAQAFRSLSARDPKPARGAPGHLAARGPGRDTGFPIRLPLPFQTPTFYRRGSARIESRDWGHYRHLHPPRRHRPLSPTV